MTNACHDFSRRYDRGMWKLVRKHWIAGLGVVIGFPGYVKDAHMWLEWLGLTSGKAPTIAASVGTTLVVLWLVANAIEPLQIRLWTFKFRKALASYNAMHDPVRVKRAVLLSKLAKLGIGGPSPREPDDEWNSYLELMQYYARVGDRKGARELGNKVRELRREKST